MKRKIFLYIIVFIFILFFIFILSTRIVCVYFTTYAEAKEEQNETKQTDYRIITAEISAYNTTGSQTDNNPCESASGINICGLEDVVACPAYLPFFTIIEIDGVKYECLDRMNKRYRNGNFFDISFDKDVKNAVQYGRKTKEVKIYDMF